MSLREELAAAKGGLSLTFKEKNATMPHPTVKKLASEFLAVGKTCTAFFGMNVNDSVSVEKSKETIDIFIMEHIME